MLGGRDCSIQRRHQKLIEESPPPRLDPGAWSRIEAGASAFAAAIGYESAGTAEFLVAGTDVYFLELNGRIQVEHPVTEAVTGLDIVELQLRVAAGEDLELDVTTRRSCDRGTPLRRGSRARFLPQAGTLDRLVLPTGIRVDAGVEEGDEIGLAYDPMMAKLIAHGADRESAIARLASALDATKIEGVITNLPFLRWLVRHPAFLAGSVSTAFLADHAPLSAPPLRTAPPSFAIVMASQPASAGSRSRRRTSTRPLPPPAPTRTGRSRRRCREPCSRSSVAVGEHASRPSSASSSSRR